MACRRELPRLADEKCPAGRPDLGPFIGHLEVAYGVLCSAFGWLRHVRVGSKADVAGLTNDVRSTPTSGRRDRRVSCRLSATRSLFREGGREGSQPPIPNSIPLEFTSS
jgi:hypothetical protein